MDKFEVKREKVACKLRWLPMIHKRYRLNKHSYFWVDTWHKGRWKVFKAWLTAPHYLTSQIFKATHPGLVHVKSKLAMNFFASGTTKTEATFHWGWVDSFHLKCIDDAQRSGLNLANPALNQCPMKPSQSLWLKAVFDPAWIGEPIWGSTRSMKLDSFVPLVSLVSLTSCKKPLRTKIQIFTVT